MSELRDVEIRRIFLPQDAQEILAMQTQAPVFRDHYPKHKEWLSKALPEILSGRRTAFAVYKSGLSEQRRLTFELVGSVILKLNYFRAAVELKNLFVREDVRGRGYGRSLLHKSADYCTKIGFRILETEVPASELSTITFLHCAGFSVAATYDSPYKSRDVLYRMRKTLSPRFTGDIFDFSGFCRWLLTFVFGFKLLNSVEPYGVQFELGVHGDESPPIGSISTTLRGLALVKDGAGDAAELHALFGKTRIDIRLAFCRDFDSAALATCDRLCITPFDQVAVHERFARYFAHKTMPFEREDISGFVLNINQNLFTRLPSSGKGFALFKNGGLGRFLRRGAKLLLVSEPSPDHPLGGVRGVAVIDDCSVGTPGQAWERYSSDNPLFERGEFESYTRGQGEVLGLRVSGFSRIPLVDYHVLLNDVISERVEIAELGCCYLSKAMVARFDRFVEPPVTGDEVRYDFALSFAGEDREHAETLASILSSRGARVFYDKYEEADLLGKDLYQHLQGVYRDRAAFCVIFLSKSYAEKLWTRHELKQAQARAFEQREEYIIPIKLDDTEIPGINRTVGYVDFRCKNVQQVADLLLAKLAYADKREDKPG